MRTYVEHIRTAVYHPTPAVFMTCSPHHVDYWSEDELMKGAGILHKQLYFPGEEHP